MGSILKWILENAESAFSDIGVWLVGGAVAVAAESGRRLLSGRARAKSARRAWLDDLCAYCADTEARMTQMFLARRRAANSSDDDAVLAFAELQKLDAVAQRLQLQATSLLEPEHVRESLFELLRRISLAKQALMVLDPKYLPESFPRDMEWIQAQVRRAVAVTAAAAEYRADSADPPLLMGFSALKDIPSDDYSDQPPSSRVVRRVMIRTSRKFWTPAELGGLMTCPIFRSLPLPTHKSPLMW